MQVVLILRAVLATPTKKSLTVSLRSLLSQVPHQTGFSSWRAKIWARLFGP